MNTSIGYSWLGQNYTAIMNAIRNSLPHVSEDLITSVVHDSCEQAAASSDRHDGRVNWLITRCRWRHVDQQRSFNAMTEFSSLATDDGDADDFDVVDNSGPDPLFLDRLQTVQEALNRLSDDEKNVIQLWMANECNTLKTAKAIGFPESSLRARIDQAVTKLRYWVGKISK